MNDPTLKLIRNVAFSVFGALVLLVTGCSSIYTVEQGERGVHTRLGAMVGIKEPGLQFKAPFIDKAVMINVRSNATRWELDSKNNTDSRMVTYSRDQQPAHLALTLTWNLPSDEKALSEIFTQYGSSDGIFRAVIVPKAVEAVKNTFGTYDAVRVIQQRDKFNADVSTALSELLAGYPIELTGVQIQDIEFSNAYEDAVEARMTAQVEVQKREQQKQTAQIDADMAVIKAEAEAKVTRLAGDAQAAAIKARAEALSSSPNLVELTLAENWDGKLPTTMVPGQAVPFINVK